MASSELKIYGDAPAPKAKIDLDDDFGYIQWTYVPMSVGGGVIKGGGKIIGKDTMLIHGSGKFVGKTFCKLVNFTLSSYNPAITYTVIVDGMNLKDGKNLKFKAQENGFKLNKSV